jgi:hypothetical protein
MGTIGEPRDIERRNGNLFPSFFFQRTINENNSVNFSYSRRIYRPSFTDLAPWVIFLDPKTFRTGNPNLKPSITDAVNASYTYKNKMVSLSYSYVAPTISQLPIIDKTSNKLITTSQNTKNYQWLALNFSLPFAVAKWWNMQNNITFAWQKSNTFYVAPVQTENKLYYFNLVQNFLLPKDLLLSLSGYYSSGWVWGLYSTKPTGAIDVAIQKKFAKNRSSLTFNVSNVLNSDKYLTLADIPEQNLLMRTRNIYGYTGFSLSFTKNFGNDKVNQKRDRTTGAEDEKDRGY